MGGLMGDGEFPLEVPAGLTGGDLKSNIHPLLGISKCKQVGSFSVITFKFVDKNLASQR